MAAPALAQGDSRYGKARPDKAIQQPQKTHKHNGPGPNAEMRDPKFKPPQGHKPPQGVDHRRPRPDGQVSHRRPPHRKPPQAGERPRHHREETKVIHEVEREVVYVPQQPVIVSQQPVYVEPPTPSAGINFGMNDGNGNGVSFGAGNGGFGLGVSVNTSGD
jgi:hypothetical protein